jgi:hypothetical protein
MTLIVTHNGYLAVDSIRYGITRNDANGATKRRRVLSNNVNKLVIPTNEVLFQNQRVLAIARCGTLGLTSQVAEDILNQGDLAFLHANRVDRSIYKPHWTGKVVVLTDVSAWEVRARAQDRMDIRITDLKDQPYATGTGCQIAIYLMKWMSVKPIDALNASMLDRSEEGNRVRYVNRKKDGSLTQPRIYKQDPDRTKLKMAQHLLEQVHDSRFVRGS